MFIKPLLIFATGAPKINLDPFGQNITANAGEPYKIKIPFKGKPKPEAKFFNGPKEIVPDDRISIEVTDDEVILTCKSAVKPDEGKITVELKNKKGSDKATVNLAVKDKPGAPKGPLNISDITPESCVLSWKPPEVKCLFLKALLFIQIKCQCLLLSV